MLPNIVEVNQAQYRVYRDENNVHFPASPVPMYALRRVFGLQLRTPKIIDFHDLHGFWQLESVYISSPEDSEITIEILDANNVPFFQDKLARHETPKTFPTVLIYNSLKLKLTASRNNINLLLVYLTPAHLAYSKDF